MTHEGAGVAKVQGFPIFVPNALPEEKAQIKVTRVKKGFAFGRLIELKEESPHRTDAPCPIYKQCGGCQLQHMTYEGQLLFKQKQVKDVLERIGKLDLSNVTVHPTLGMEDPWNYRNKAQVPVGEREGGLVAGFYQQRSHDIIDMSACLIQQSKNDEAVQAVKDICAAYGVKAYNEERHKGWLRHISDEVVDIFFAPDDVCFVPKDDVCFVWIDVLHDGFDVRELRCDVFDDFRFVRKITCSCDEDDHHFARDDAVSDHNVTEPAFVAFFVIGFDTVCCTDVFDGLDGFPNKTNVIFGNETNVIWGEEYIYDLIGDVKFAISARSFYQVNPEQTKVLYDKALEYAELQGEETVIDAYCGIGTISLFLAKQAKKVYGVEIVPEAIEDAKRNAELNGITNAEFAVGEAETVIPKWYEEGITADTLVVDPPRKGCDEALLRTIIDMKPKRVVYVSCNPGTLASSITCATHST